MWGRRQTQAHWGEDLGRIPGGHGLCTEKTQWEETEGKSAEVWSGHHVVTSPTWGFSIYKTSSQNMAQILSVVLEKELKVLDCA